jgi:hypothetical protein
LQGLFCDQSRAAAMIIRLNVKCLIEVKCTVLHNEKVRRVSYAQDETAQIHCFTSLKILFFT